MLILIADVEGRVTQHQLRGQIRLLLLQPVVLIPILIVIMIVFQDIHVVVLAAPVVDIGVLSVDQPHRQRQLQARVMAVGLTVLLVDTQVNVVVRSVRGVSVKPVVQPLLQHHHQHP